LRALTKQAQRLPFVSARWAYATVLFGISAVLGICVYLLGPRIITQAHEIAREIPQSIESIRVALDRFEWGQDVMRLVDHVLHSQQMAKAAGAYATAFVGLATDLVIIAAIGVFLAANPRLYRRGLLELAPDSRRAQISDLLEDIAGTVRAWLLGQLIPMSVLGVGTLIGLWLLGIPLAFTLALFTAAMLFIPYAGAVIAFVPTALVAVIQGPGTLIYVTILYLAVHCAEGYVITPLAQRHVVHLPPALTLFSQLAMWKVAGFLGVVVATPLAAVCLVTVQKVYLNRPKPNIDARSPSE
ncbi:MAG TPA: AI-2E family transporter, partial [Terriglobia bacterium]|nr:AI-2E family transporter [Terriglobia bacterium]